MPKHSQFVFLSSVLLFVLFVSLVCPTAVYADDGTPPPPATEESVQPPMEESEPEAPPAAVTEAPVVDEATVTEEPAAVATDVPLEKSSEAVTIGEVLEVAPEGTDVVVLDENGEALPLATAESAEVVQSSDPMWCPAGVSPMALVAGCTASYGRLADLVNFLIANQADPIYDQAGVIWIQNDYNSSTAEDPAVIQFVLQGGAGNPFAHMSPYALTIQGGWMGDSAGTIDHGDPSTLAGDALQIIEWGGAVTIRDVEFLNTGAIGLFVETQGDITLSNVDANGNSAWGADLNSGGNIDIRSSTFGGGAASGNFFGLDTVAVGSTTLVDVTASGNGSIGAILASGGPLTMSESHFDENFAVGLLASSGSSVTFSNVTASDNGSAALGLPGALVGGSGPITVTDSHFDRNQFGGLLVQSGSEVSLSGVTANGNAFYGANVDAAGSVWVSDSTFDGNTDPLGEAFGLRIASDQSITLDHVSASNNDGSGAFLGTFENATVVCSQFQDNANVGVDGWDVDGTFTLNDVTFGGNGMDYDGTPVFMSGGCKLVSGKNQKSSALPLHIVPVSGGEQVELDCGSYSGTKLVLPNTDSVILPCPIKDQGVLTGKTTEQLPAPLGAGFSFASALAVQVMRGGESVDETQVGMTIDFVIPDGMQATSLAILWWDEQGAQWIEVSGAQTGDGRFVANSKYTGVYVLVTK